MKYFGAPKWKIYIVVITWPITVVILFPLLGILTLATCGVFKGMDLLEDFMNWQTDLL